VTACSLFIRGTTSPCYFRLNVIDALVPRNLAYGIHDIMGSPSPGAPNAGEVGKSCVFRPVEKSPAQTRYRRKFVSICHRRPRPRLCAGGGISSTTGGSRNLMITVTVQLISTRFVVPGSLLMTPTALHARCAIVESTM